MRDKRNGSTLLLLMGMLLLSTALLIGCSHKEPEPYVSPESGVYKVINGQDIKVIGPNNKDEVFQPQGDWYLISGEKLKELWQEGND